MSLLLFVCNDSFESAVHGWARKCYMAVLAWDRDRGTDRGRDRDRGRDSDKNRDRNRDKSESESETRARAKAKQRQTERERQEREKERTGERKRQRENKHAHKYPPDQRQTCTVQSFPAHPPRLHHQNHAPSFELQVPPPFEPPPSHPVVIVTHTYVQIHKYMQRKHARKCTEV